MDFHFAEANSNVLLGTSLDPVSKTPDYKVCAVRIENLNGDRSRLNQKEMGESGT
jgi:formate dehydrogenase alpha subunit